MYVNTSFIKKWLVLFPVLCLAFMACRKNNSDTSSKDAARVSQFVYDGMSLYYLWADEMEGKKPGTNARDPKSYFRSILNDMDKKQQWSYITDDVDALLNDFSGTPKGFGWGLGLYKTDRSAVVGYVRYVFPNTPAANAGIKRGDIIDEINNARMTESNYLELFGGGPIEIGISDQNGKNKVSKKLTPVTIQTDPVLKDTVYKNRPQFAGKKIGYLFYTDFISNYNNRLYETFSRFKTEGVTDLVIDLRYNYGGAIQAAAYLASLIAPRNVVARKSVFTMLNYNSFVNDFFDEENISRKDSFINSGKQNPLNANLNLSKVYIIATGNSYSASELLTFCLKPYMNVVHIGSNTGGKFTGSWTMHAYNSYRGRAITIYDEEDINSTEKNVLSNWAMQPIVAKYADKNGKDFENPGYLKPDIKVESIEDQPSAWRPIGDVRDYLLSKAISEITGIRSKAASTMSQRINNSTKTRLSSPSDEAKQSIQLNIPEKYGSEKDFLLKLKARHLQKNKF